MANDKDEPTDCISGPIETNGDALVLRIPLRAGGDRFVELTKAIATVDEDVLEIRVPVFVAQQLKIRAGDAVTVGIREGKLTIWAG